MLFSSFAGTLIISFVIIILSVIGLVSILIVSKCLYIIVLVLFITKVSFLDVSLNTKDVSILLDVKNTVVSTCCTKNGFLAIILDNLLAGVQDTIKSNMIRIFFTPYHLYSLVYYQHQF